MRYRWEKVALTGCQVGCALRWSLEFAADCNKEFTASWSPPLARKEPTVQLKERWDVGAAEPRSCCVQRSVTVCGNAPWFHLALLCEGVGLCRVSYEQSQKSPWGIGVVIGVWVSSLSLCSRQSYCLSAVNGAWILMTTQTRVSMVQLSDTILLPKTLFLFSKHLFDI